MKKCSHCDREVMSDAKFCQYCGGEIDTIKPESVEHETTNNQGNEAPPLPEINVFSQYNSPQGTPPPNKGMVWLIVSSVLTFLGCFCFGIGLFQIPTIITSAISLGRYNRGDYEGSDRLAKTSMILFFSILAFSIIVTIIVALFYYNAIDFDSVINDYY